MTPFNRSCGPATEVKTVAIFKALPNQSSALEEMLLAMLRQSRQELGNLRWNLWRDQTEPNRFVVDELYVDAAAVRVTRRMECSQLTSRPSRSTVLPFELKLGKRKTDTEASVSSKRIIRLLGMSDQMR